MGAQVFAPNTGDLTHLTLHSGRLNCKNADVRNQTQDGKEAYEEVPALPSRSLQEDGPVLAQASWYRLSCTPKVQRQHAHAEHRLWLQQENTLSLEEWLLQVLGA